MPREKRPERPTRADAFWKAEDARKTPEWTPHGMVWASEGGRPHARLLTGGKCAVDQPLEEARVKRLVAGSIADLRADLAIVAASAWSEAATAYGEQIAAPRIQERQAEAKRLAKAVRAFVTRTDDDLAALERLAEKVNDGNGAEVDALRPAIKTRAGIVRAGSALLDHLDAMVAEERPGGAPASNAVRLEERAFFVAVADWWAEKATAPDKRGASAVRNRIAAALWQDLGGGIPDGLAAEGNERWAARKFREHRQNRTE